MMWYLWCFVGWQLNSIVYKIVIMNKCDVVGGCLGVGVYVWDCSSNN